MMELGVLAEIRGDRALDQDRDAANAQRRSQVAWTACDRIRIEE